MRRAEVYLYDRLAGHLTEDEDGYTFQYDADYLANDPVMLSVNFPLHNGKFHDRTLFPFFDGLIPEGWLLEIAVDNWKLDPNDRMGLLLATGFGLETYQMSVSTPQPCQPLTSKTSTIRLFTLTTNTLCNVARWLRMRNIQASIGGHLRMQR